MAPKAQFSTRLRSWMRVRSRFVCIGFAEASERKVYRLWYSSRYACTSPRGPKPVDSQLQKTAKADTMSVLVDRQGLITNIACDDASEFLSVLNPIGGVFSQSPVRRQYIFRGVGSDQYALLPSAFRDGLTSSFTARQCASEIATLRLFFDIAARHGIRLPEDSQTLRATLEDWQARLDNSYSTPPFTWPPVDFYSLIGLAQHHGIATRALDWTWNPLTAAYFSASSTVDAGRVCVWACSYSTFVAQRRSRGRANRLVIFTAPGADNDNLRAQSGLFMLWSQTVRKPMVKFVPIPYDQLLVRSSREPLLAPALYRVTLPASQRHRMRQHLAAAGVTAGALFPGLWGVAREHRETRELEKLVSEWDRALSPFTEQVLQQIIVAENVNDV